MVNRIFILPTYKVCSSTLTPWANLERQRMLRHQEEGEEGGEVVVEEGQVEAVVEVVDLEQLSDSVKRVIYP